jgi:hypothetical protein
MLTTKYNIPHKIQTSLPHLFTHQHASLVGDFMMVLHSIRARAASSLGIATSVSSPGFSSTENEKLLAMTPSATELTLTADPAYTTMSFASDSSASLRLVGAR